MALPKKVIVVGGTGFLGYHIIKELSSKGWDVTALGLPDTYVPVFNSGNVNVVLRDYEQTPETDLQALLQGHVALIFAAGADDRVTPKRPAYAYFHHANVEACTKLLNIAKKAGIRRAVILGSYFAHFDRLWPELRLAERHSYIRSRVEQEQKAVSIPGLEVDVLELPYVFGGMPGTGKHSLWLPLIKYIRFTPVVFFMKGGSACVSADSVGAAVAGALEQGKGGRCYPISDENLTWSGLLQRLAVACGRKIRVVTLPIWLIQFGLYGLWLFHLFRGLESGLDLRYFASLQTAETFIDPHPSREALGYQSGGLDQAFRETVLDSQ
jgi:dihydroflavonol-4-reductase